MNSRAITCLIASILVLMFCTEGLALEFGSKVGPMDVDSGLPLQAFSVVPVMRYLDNLPLGYDANDCVYLDMMNPGIIDEGDLRLSSFGHFQPGTQVVVSDPDYGASLNGFINPSIVFLNLYGSAECDDNDPVYLVADIGSTRTQTNDLRLNTVSGLAAGTKIKDFHPDHDKQFTLPIPAWTFMLRDVTGPGYSIGDKLYLHKDPGSSQVDRGDVRLSV